jgi:hypothetical protein
LSTLVANALSGCGFSPIIVRLSPILPVALPAESFLHDANRAACAWWVW